MRPDLWLPAPSFACRLVEAFELKIRSANAEKNSALQLNPG